MDNALVERLHRKIFAFYRDRKRRFPWRETTDRYAVMVSEVMLQQTQAERVVPRFMQWMERFPDIAALAEAPLREVLQHWSGLGYNARGHRLHRCAGIILEQHGGQVPPDPSILLTFPGIGPYTSRSIPVFADNRDIAAVDTNIRRILIHELQLPESITPAILQQYAAEILPTGRSRDWHNALMDYGALELTSRKSGIAPLSRQSPFRESRRWYRGMIVRELLASGTIPRSGIEERYSLCPHGIGTIVDTLLQEGMVEEYGSPPLLRISEQRDGG